MKNPFVQNHISIISYITVWTIILFDHVMILFVLSGISLENAFFDAVIYNLLFFFLGLSLWYPSIYLSIDTNKIWKTIINHAAGGIITSVIWVYLGYFILSNLIKSEDYLKFLGNSLAWRLNIGLLFYLITIIFYYVAYYYKGYKEKLHSEGQLKALINEAELKSLKYQINPHFVFNSLNSISSLTISDPDRARDMTIKLSSFLRTTLSQDEKQLTTLSKELSNCRLYMEIEKIRFEEHLEFIEEIGQECKKLEIPNMILQPLFENAIKHGVYESTEKITIRLTCKEEGKYLKITVQNNYDPQGISRKGEGIGLLNIKSRLKLIYNQDNLLTFDKLENLFTVNIYIPDERN